EADRPAERLGGSLGPRARVETPAGRELVADEREAGALATPRPATVDGPEGFRRRRRPCLQGGRIAPPGGLREGPRGDQRGRRERRRVAIDLKSAKRDEVQIELPPELCGRPRGEITVPGDHVADPERPEESPGMARRSG